MCVSVCATQENVISSMFSRSTQCGRFANMLLHSICRIYKFSSVNTLINVVADAKTLNRAVDGFIGREHAEQKMFRQNVQYFTYVDTVFVHLGGGHFEHLFSLQKRKTKGMFYLFSMSFIRWSKSTTYFYKREKYTSFDFLCRKQPAWFDEVVLELISDDCFLCMMMLKPLSLCGLFPKILL